MSAQEVTVGEEPQMLKLLGANSVDPDKTVNSVDPNKTVNSVDQDKTVNSVDPNKTVNSVDQDKTVNSVDPNKTVNSVDQDKTVNSVDPDKTLNMFNVEPEQTAPRSSLIRVCTVCQFLPAWSVFRINTEIRLDERVHFWWVSEWTGV